MTSPRTPRQLLGWTMPAHVMSFDVAPNELTLWCFKHEPRVGSGRITRDPEHRPDQIIDFLKAHAHGETVEYRPNLDPDVAWPLSEVLPETPEPPKEERALLGWALPDHLAAKTIKTDRDTSHHVVCRHISHEGGFPGWIFGEGDSERARFAHHLRDHAHVPASQSVPAVPVSSTGGKETGEATETATEALRDTLAALVDPDVWAAREDDQDTVGAQWQHTDRRRLSLAAAERILAAGWRPPLPEVMHDAGETAEEAVRRLAAEVVGLRQQMSSPLPDSKLACREVGPWIEVTS